MKSAVSTVLLLIMLLAACSTPGSESPSGSVEPSPSSSALASASASEVPPSESAAPSGSEAPTVQPTSPATPTPQPTPAGAQIVQFTVTTPVYCSGEAVIYPTISWVVTGATGVNIGIDGPGAFNSDPYPVIYTLNGNGAEEIPFACGEASHTYTLSTEGGNPDAQQTKTIFKAPDA